MSNLGDEAAVRWEDDVSVESIYWEEGHGLRGLQEVVIMTEFCDEEMVDVVVGVARESLVQTGGDWWDIVA